MAITFHTQPQVFTPGSNPVVWTFSSDETAQANFSYIVEVYVDTILHSTHQVFPQNGIYAKFNVSEIMRGILSSPLITDGTFTNLYSSAFDSVKLIVYEQYGTPPAIEASDESESKFVFNAALRHPDFVNWNYENYNMSSVNPQISGMLFLTSWPRSYKYFCGLTEKIFLGVLSDEQFQFFSTITLYDSTNTIIVSASFQVSFAEIRVFDFSPINIDNNTTITAGDFASAAYYTIRLGVTTNISSVLLSELFTIYIDTECQRYPSTRLHWLNKFGVWDSFTFTLVSTHSTKVDANRYEREKGIWDAENYVYPLYQGEQTTFSKRAEDILTLNSDWINEDVQNWLVRELYESPSVYMESDGNFEPVNVTNASYKLKVNRRDGLIQELVEIQRTYSYNSQLN